MNADSEVTKNVDLFDLTINSQLETEESTPEEASEAVQTNIELASDTTEDVKEEEDSDSQTKVSLVFFSAANLDYAVRFKPSFELPQQPDAPVIGPRIYASCKILDITPLGLMTL